MKQAITIRFDHTQVGRAVERQTDAGDWDMVGLISYGDTLDTKRTEREIVERLGRDYAVSVAS